MGTQDHSIPAGKPRLSMSGVSVRRGAREVLAGIGLTIAPGEVVVVIGPNGSGKSSLVMAAAGLLPASGVIDIEGRAIAALDPLERARLIAYVPQRSELMAPLLVREVVAMGRYVHGDGGNLGTLGTTATAAIVDALTAVDAVALAQRRFTELSGGEAQRVLLARALATGADTLLLDEPTSALDVAHRLALARMVRTLACRGKAVLIAVHDLTEAAAVGDRVILLSAGRVLKTGTPTEVIAPGPVREAYGIDVIAGGGYGYRERP